MSKFINVSIFSSKSENKKDPKTCKIEEFQTCDLYRNNALATNNKNLKPCLKCEKYENMKAEFENSHPSRVCEICGEKFYLYNNSDGRKTCISCTRRPATYAKHKKFNKPQGKKRMAKRCMCVETGAIFRSTMEAADTYDTTPSCVSLSARTGKTVGGFTWRYV